MIMLIHPVRLIAILFFALLQACSGPGPGGAQEVGGDNSSPGVIFEPDEVIGVVIEANDAMVASWQNDLYNAVTPAKAHALEGMKELNDLATTRISIVALNYDFQEISGTPSSIPNYRVVKKQTSGYEIQFDALYVEQINIVIKVRFGNGEVLYAPLHSLANPNDSITVNIGSHYVVKKLFDTINSTSELDQLLPCENSVSNCPNQFLAKAALLAQAGQMAQRYEIDLSNITTFSNALNFLDQNLDFRTHIETAVNEITRDISPIAKGTPRDFTITDGETISRLTYNQEYNSLWFALSLNDDRPDDDEDKVKLATASSVIVAENELDNDLPIYPFLNQNTTLLDVRRDALISDIPFTRTVLSINENSFTRDNNEPINSFTSQLSDTRISTQAFLLNDRRIEQTIPDIPNSATDIGWQFNPLFTKLYRVNDYEPDDTLDADPSSETPDFGAEPTWLIAANYSTGAAYELSINQERVAQTENLNLFSWEIHGQRTDASFSVNDINGKEYGVIGYSLKLNDGGDVMTLFAETLRWNAAGEEILEDQDADHYRSYTLTRDENNGVTFEGDLTGINFGDHDFATIETSESNKANPDGFSENQGLIGLDGGTNAPFGHSTQNGKHLAFALNTPERGRGLMIATELRSGLDSPIFSGEQYQLQGNSFNMTSTLNTLRNFNGSTLIISDGTTEDCQANLTMTSITLNHDIESNTLEQAKLDPTETEASTTCRLNGSEIELVFADVLGQPLTLKGFITQQGSGTSSEDTPGRLITLLWIQSDSLGLVFANLEQNLSPTFDP